MKKVFITGITGFVGRHLSQILKDTNYNISGTYYPENTVLDYRQIFPKNKVYFCDITKKKDILEILAAETPDILVHLAGIASVKYTMNNISEAIDINLKGFTNILEALRDNNLLNTKIILISSGDVYKPLESIETFITETSDVLPLTPYAAAKYACENILNFYCNFYNARAIIVRPFNHSGAGQSPEFVISSFAKQISAIEKNKCDSVIKTGNLDIIRDFSDVRDIVFGYKLLIDNFEKLTANKSLEIFNIGAGIVYSLREILNKLVSYSTNSNIQIQTDNALLRKVDPKYFRCDSSKLKSLTGWQPQYTIDDMLKSILNYWRANI